MTQLAQGLGFDLTDTLTGNVEELADFLESVVAFFGDAEALAQNLLFTGSEVRKNLGELLGEFCVDDFLGRSHGLLVLNEITQAGILFVADGRFEGDGLLGNFEHLRAWDHGRVPARGSGTCG